jgi:hypothetical protein
VYLRYLNHREGHFSKEEWLFWFTSCDSPLYSGVGQHLDQVLGPAMPSSGTSRDNGMATRMQGFLIRESAYRPLAGVLAYAGLSTVSRSYWKAPLLDTHRGAPQRKNFIKSDGRGDGRDA